MEFESWENYQMIENYVTNTYVNPGCVAQYGEYFPSYGLNQVYSFILEWTTGGCASLAQSYTFTVGYQGTYFNQVYAPLESYDYTCSDYSGWGSGGGAYYNNAIYQYDYGISYSTPTFSAYVIGSIPPCWSNNPGYGSVSITWY